MKERIKNTIFRVTNKMEGNYSFAAIRQGMIMLIPLLVVSSMALMLKSLPFPAYQNFLSGLLGGSVVEILDFIYSGVLNFFSVILSVTTSISYAMLRRKNAKKNVGLGDAIVLSIITLAALAGYSGIQYENFSVSALGNLNTFMAVVITLISGKLFFFIKSKKIFRLKKHGTNNDILYLEAVEGILPAMIIIVFFAVLFQIIRSIFGISNIGQMKN